MGNVNSVMGAIEKLGHHPIFTRDEQEIKSCDAIILPGVGSFRDGMNHLKKFGLDKILRESVLVNKKPFLGICLGMQMLASSGNEFGKHEGLDFIPGSIERLQDAPGFKIPHVGWNEITLVTPDTLFQTVKNNLFYFVHSYHFKVANQENAIATCDYSEKITAVVKKENIIGVQFHPEKSQAEGLLVLRNFIEQVQ